jgi:hypothetical protein
MVAHLASMSEMPNLTRAMSMGIAKSRGMDQTRSITDPVAGLAADLADNIEMPSPTRALSMRIAKSRAMADHHLVVSLAVNLAGLNPINPRSPRIITQNLTGSGSPPRNATSRVVTVHSMGLGGFHF